MTTPSYFTFIWKEIPNRKYLLYGLSACILQFILFNLLYPFPDFFNDSFWYVYAAAHHLDISIWPIGYSKFLSAFHALTPSDTALIAFQYFFFQLSAIHFYFTLLYFFNIKHWVQKTFYGFIILNPLTLYIANTVASDTIFGALTLLWLAGLIWIMFRPHLRDGILTSILLLCCFTMRNTAYYYPIISTLAILFSKQVAWKKGTGIALPIILIFFFVQYSKNAAYRVTGNRTFSFLTGWQMANNVLYMYNHISIDSTQLPDDNARKLNRLAAGFFKQTPSAQYQRFLSSTDGNVFIIHYASPLKHYLADKIKSSPSRDPVRDWGIASYEFEPFGHSIIIHHPWGYFRYFVLMNAVNYFIPQLSDLKSYSNNRTEIEPLIAQWFHYSSNRITCISSSLQGYLFIYQIFFFLLHIYFLGITALILAKIKTLQFPKSTTRLYGLLMMYLLVNAAFSVSVTINLLRYQYVPMFILLLTNILLTENIFKLYADKPKPVIP